MENDTLLTLFIDVVLFGISEYVLVTLPTVEPDANDRERVID